MFLYSGSVVEWRFYTVSEGLFIIPSPIGNLVLPYCVPPIQSKQPAQLNYTFRGLQFETHYSVCVLGNHRVNSYLQNNCTFKPLYTGSCHKFYQQSNRSHCGKTGG